MNIINQNIKFKLSTWIKLSMLFLAFISGGMYSFFLYKNAEMIPVELATEYINKTGFKFIKNSIEGNTDNIETMYLNVKYKEWRKLVNQRNEIWNYTTVIKYFPFQWADSIDKVEIKGKLNYQNKLSKIKLKLLGMNPDHYGDTKKWSFRISTKGDNTIDGQKKFNLLIPPSRDFCNDFLGQNFLKELDMIFLRMKPVKVVLNGEQLGVYTQEEFYDKRLIEYNRFRESAIVRLNNYEIKVSENKYLKYKEIIDKFSKKIDLIKKKEISIIDLFDIDKMSSRIAMSILFGDFHSLIDFNQRYYLNPFTVKLEPLGREWQFLEYNNQNDVINNIQKIKSLENTLYNELLNDLFFVEKLNENIRLLSSSEFLKKIELKNKKEQLELKNNLHSEYLFFDSPLPLINKNAKILRKRNEWQEIFNRKTQEKKMKSISKYAKINNDTILIDKSITLKEKLKIVAGYKVVVSPGVHITLEDKGQIVSESPFIAIGTKNDSIIFKGNKENIKGGILFLNTKNSVFKYVKFKSIRNYSDEFRTLPGSICFYESSVSFDKSTFDTSYNGDDLLNMVRSNFTITNSELLNSKADALDSDFSKGTITNTLFKYIGNDAIDVSGSVLDISDLIIDETKDKGISVGEDSHIVGKEIEIKNTSLSLTSKDFSTLKLNRVIIDNCDVVFTVFQKKPEYGPASISCENVKYTNYKKEYLVQEKSRLVVNSMNKEIRVKDVESKLYGAIYGKSSK